MKTSRPSWSEARYSLPVCGLSTATLPMVCGSLANTSGVSRCAAACAIASLPCCFRLPRGRRVRPLVLFDNRTYVLYANETHDTVVAITWQVAPTLGILNIAGCRGGGHQITIAEKKGPLRGPEDHEAKEWWAGYKNPVGDPGNRAGRSGVPQLLPRH